MKKFLKSIWGWVKPYTTPKMIPFLVIAWLITNGWSYIFVALGPKINQSWMTWLGGLWITLLWFPLTIEKPITIGIALLLYRLVYRERFSKKEKATD